MMELQKAVSQLNAKDVARLLRMNFYKLGLELKEDSYEEKNLVKEVMTYQGKLWVYTFNDMFSSFALHRIKGQDKLTPVFTGYFISQLRHAFFDTILAPKKKKSRHIPASTNHNRGAASYQSRSAANCLSVGDVMKRGLGI